MTSGHIKSHCPDAAWLINLIGFFDPNYEIFAKDYEHSPVRAVENDENVIADSLGIFLGLSAKRKLRALVRLPVS